MTKTILSSIYHNCFGTSSTKLPHFPARGSRLRSWYGTDSNFAIMIFGLGITMQSFTITEANEPLCSQIRAAGKSSTLSGSALPLGQFSIAKCYRFAQRSVVWHFTAEEPTFLWALRIIKIWHSASWSETYYFNNQCTKLSLTLKVHLWLWASKTSFEQTEINNNILSSQLH